MGYQGGKGRYCARVSVSKDNGGLFNGHSST